MGFNVKEISYQFDGREEPTIRNVSFQIATGEIAAIVGKSGCGKSTLANILSGVIPNLLTNGELSGTFDSDATGKIAVVSQSPENQLFGYSVEDALVFGMENMGVPPEEMSERLEYVLDLLNIQLLRARSIATLSGGQRQAVCIASTLAMEPQVLIMDEPVSSLDPNGKNMVQKILRQLRDSGQTTIIIDNNLDWCSDVVDHVIGLEDGAVAFDGTKEEFFQDFDIQDRLGVYIPQEAEIYRELKKRFDQVDMFYTLEGAKREIAKLLPQEERPAGVKDETPPFERAIRIEQLNKTFDDGFRALIDINVDFPKGAVTTILGQNGSGKTTLVRHLNGLIKPTSGKMLYLGNPLLGKSVAEISHDIILVFQHPEHMLFEETVYRELVFCANAQGVPFQEEDVDRILKEYGFEKDKEELPVNLSMGKKHLLTILSVLFSSADVIILDEPTLGLDNSLKNRLREIVRGLKEQGKTVIMISHEIPLVFELSDYIYLINNGESVFFGDKLHMIRNMELLENVKINVPPVVKLAHSFGLPEEVVTSRQFAEAVVQAVAGRKGGRA